MVGFDPTFLFFLVRNRGIRWSEPAGTLEERKPPVGWVWRHSIFSFPAEDQQVSGEWFCDLQYGDRTEECGGRKSPPKMMMSTGFQNGILNPCRSTFFA